MVRFVASQSETPPRTWVYPSGRTDGAFRAFKVADLLRSNPKVNLYEWKSIRFPSKTLSSDLQAISPPYIAISHVWGYGAEVDSAAYTGGMMIRRLRIKIKSPPYYKDISWVGLVQIANAAAQLGAGWIWLDFLCIDQKAASGSEVPFQICIMRDIYENAASVVVMIGGIPRVQSVGTPTGWMDRAWTLQESFVNWRQTWVYVLWPGPPGSTSVRDTAGNRYPLMIVTGEPNKRLIRLRDLLDMADNNFSAPYSNVVVLDGLYAAPTRKYVPRHALRTAIHPNRLISAAGIWRSMFLRTSGHPVDIVYSVMLCFGLQIDPFRDVRTYKDLFRDLARKTAAISKIGPSWFTINGVGGSRYPRDPISRILPRCPDTLANGQPVYTSNAGPSRWVGRYVDAFDDYIDRFDMLFVTHSHPHIINARMFSFGPWSNFRIINSRRGIAKISLKTNRGRLYYHAPGLTAGTSNVQVVYVGRVGKAQVGTYLTPIGGRTTGDRRFVLFIQWDRIQGRWNVLGDGVFVINSGSTFKPPTSRWILTIGAAAQTVRDKWPSQRTSGPYQLDRWAIQRFKYHDYGVVPLKDWNYRRPMDKLISWVGAKPQKVKQARWTKLQMKFRLSGLSNNALKTRLKKPGRLYLVSGMGSRPARISTPTTTMLTQMGHLRMTYAYSDWKKSVCARLARAGIEGILIPKADSRRRATAEYYVAVIYGEYMVYLMSKPHLKTRWEFTEISVIPYRKANRPIINRNYIVQPPPQPSPLTWNEWETGLQQRAILQQQAFARQQLALVLRQRIALAMQPRCAPRLFFYRRC
ncbi:hypothetical protein M501DRAFT_1002206 [Patellaria atrata CBS 101060]|uniref:Heterokaryon incompatibility domain-containing protein n=1 Tax=Patellaria atrata CBS 101060 TaxID=1346257 RepID=A0A9P4S0P9_9PEZI|nr:hypothetical protein M501DRAFT_1002206 [Patellaria atrata CBS 101060]